MSMRLFDLAAWRSPEKTNVEPVIRYPCHPLPPPTATLTFAQNSSLCLLKAGDTRSSGSNNQVTPLNRTR